MKLLDIAALQTSYAAGKVSAVALHAVKAAFEVRWTTAQGTARLAGSGGNDGWCFLDASEALLLLKEIGIHSVQVDISGWQPAAESAYDDWVTAKVEASLTGLRNGTNKTYSPSEWAEIRAARGWAGKII
jgi:hypothetical protein